MPEPRRAVVLSGGGAKGIFESGVIHALTQTGYEADVVTGSSVGALNAVAYAEIVRARREEGEEAGHRVADSLLGMWQGLDRLGVADVDGIGRRVWLFDGGKVVLGAALVGAAISGGRATSWLTVLERLAAFAVGLGAMATGGFVLWTWIRLPQKLRRHVREGLPGPPIEEAPRAVGHLAAHPWRDRLLRLAGLSPSIFGAGGLRRALAGVVPRERRLSDYHKLGVDVRFTRTNVRTGRTEVSEYLEARDVDRPGFDRGLRVLGDPRAVEAALASSAFPSAYPPVSADAIYPPEENRSLYARARERALAKTELRRLFGPQAKAQYVWLMSLVEELAEEDRNLTRTGGEARLLEKLRSHFYGPRALWNRVSIRALFVLAETRGWPQLTLADEESIADRYFDGGILDNTPLSTALTALRERDAGEAAPVPANGAAAPVHEMLVVLLSPRARRRYLATRQAARLEGPALGMRALRLQAERRVEDDIRTAEKIDRLLSEKGWLEDELKSVERAAPVAAAAAAPEKSAPGAESWAELFSHELGGEDGEPPPPEVAPEEKLARIEVTRVYPTWDLPWILALDDRLGFDAEEARAFQVRGCRDTMVALRMRHVHATRSGRAVSAAARRAIELTGNGGPDTPPAGWICPTERCSLRATCDRVAAGERAAEAPA